MITGDHHNQEVTEIREIIIENDMLLYHQKGQISQSWGCQPKTKGDGLHHGKSGK